MTASPFDYVKAINSHKDIIREDDIPERAEADYVPFLANKAFSFHLDTIFYANEANLNTNIPKQMQFDYYLHSIRPAKRFGWVKKTVDDSISVIQEYFKCSHRDAVMYRRILTDDQLKMIQEKNNKGGSP